MSKKQLIGYALILVGLLTGVTWYVSQFTQPILPANINNSVIIFFAALLAVLGGLAAFKDTVELIHIFSGREQRTVQQSPPMSQTNFNREVHAQVIVTGGQNVTVNTAPQEINDRIVHSESTQQQAELFQKLMGENVRQSFFWKERLEAYSRTWRILQQVRVAGDALWESAAQDNILAFANALQSASIRVKDDAIFFEKEDYKELLRLLTILGNFRVGKQRLINIRSRDDLDTQYAVMEIASQVSKNRKIKNNYENLLDQIMEAFRERLSR